MYRACLPAPAIRIVVPGEPFGYNTALRSWNKTSVNVLRWYNKVRKVFNAAGIKTPLFADSAYPVYLDCRCYFSSGVHCDPGNTHKGFTDALFYKSVGPGDKYVGGSFDVPFYSEDNPRTEIELRGWYLRKKYKHLITHSWLEALEIQKDA